MPSTTGPTGDRESRAWREPQFRETEPLERGAEASRRGKGGGKGDREEEERPGKAAREGKPQTEDAKVLARWGRAQSGMGGARKGAEAPEVKLRRFLSKRFGQARL